MWAWSDHPQVAVAPVVLDLVEVVFLRPLFQAKYEQLHRNHWPEALTACKKSTFGPDLQDCAKKGQL